MEMNENTNNDQDASLNQQMYSNQNQLNVQQMSENPYPPYGYQMNATLSSDASNSKKHKSKKKIIIIAVAVIVVAAIVTLICIGLSGPGKLSAKAVAKAYVRALNEEDAEMLYELVDSKEAEYVNDNGIWDYIAAELVSDPELAMKLCEEKISNFYNEGEGESGYGLGKIKNIGIEINSVEKYEGDNLEEVKENYKNNIGYEISQYAVVNFTLVITCKDGEVKEDKSINVYKRGLKWYYVL